MKFKYPIYRGILFDYPRGQKALDGSETMMVRARNFHSMVGQYLLLIEQKRILAIIKVTDGTKINVQQFNKLHKYHKISDANRKLWFKGKKVFYAFPFVIVQKFKKPIKIDYIAGPRVFIKPENIKYV